MFALCSADKFRYPEGCTHVMAQTVFPARQKVKEEVCLPLELTTRGSVKTVAHIFVVMWKLPSVKSAKELNQRCLVKKTTLCGGFSAALFISSFSLCLV